MTRGNGNGRVATPKHLRPKTKKWFREVVATFELEPHHVRLLTLAGEAWDRAEQSRQAIAEKGLTYTDRFGCPRSRPEVAVERDSRVAFARLLRELQLDAPPPGETRVPRIGGG
jgi:phage terminase small subunit